MKVFDRYSHKNEDSENFAFKKIAGESSCLQKHYAENYSPSNFSTSLASFFNPQVSRRCLKIFQSNNANCFSSKKCYVHFETRFNRGDY